MRRYGGSNKGRGIQWGTPYGYAVEFGNSPSELRPLPLVHHSLTKGYCAMTNNEAQDNDYQYRLMRAKLRSIPGHDICHICDEKIDMSLPYTDKWSWTADHVQSRDVGGDVTSLANMLSAHRSCNSKRGAGVVIRTKSSRVW